MYSGGDPFPLTALGPANKSECEGGEVVTLKPVGVNRLAAVHCLLPHLCTRQLSWRSRFKAEFDDIGSWLGDARKRVERGGGADRREFGNGDWHRKAQAGGFAIARLCLLFIKLSTLIVSGSRPHNVLQNPSLFIHFFVLCSAGLRLSYISPASNRRL